MSTPLLALLLCFAEPPAGHERQVAPGWTVPDSPHYQAVIDRKTAHGGRGSLLLKTTEGDPQGIAARQRIRAEAWRGKRIRLSGWIKTDHADRGGALWLRVDMSNGDYVLDGMFEKKSGEWTRMEVVANVPEEALGLTFGLRMTGKGEVWADDLTIDVVPPTTPVTTIERRKSRGTFRADDFLHAPLRAVNLNFEM